MLDAIEVSGARLGEATLRATRTTNGGEARPATLGVIRKVASGDASAELMRSCPVPEPTMLGAVPVKEPLTTLTLHDTPLVSGESAIRALDLAFTITRQIAAQLPPNFDGPLPVS